MNTPSVTDSLEARWFVAGPLAPDLRAWFDALGPPVPPEARTDRYLVPAESDSLGLKIREGTVQAKQRTGLLGLRTLAPGVRATAESWRKWTLGTAVFTPVDGWVDVHKTRRQRTLVLVGRGRAARGRGPTGGRCALELSEVEIGGQVWHSVCLEASGASASVRWAALRGAARRWLPSAPPLPAAALMGYPEWLRRHAD